MRRASPVVRVRRGRSADEAEIMRMMRPFNHEEGIRFRPAAMKRALRSLMAEPSLGRVLVAPGGKGTLGGYAVLAFGYDLEWAGRDAFITEVWVEPSVRGRGVGAALIDRAVVEARRAGAGAVHLVVRPGNRGAIRVYERSGFKTVPRALMTRVL
jgi:ribosomal protein S18 acetylase RimI-like enzyme